MKGYCTVSASVIEQAGRVASPSELSDIERCRWDRGLCGDYDREWIGVRGVSTLLWIGVLTKKFIYCISRDK